MKLLITIMVMLLSIASGLCVELRDYSADSHAIYFSGKSVFSIPRDQNDGKFEGPMLFGDRVVFIERSGNRAIALKDDRVVESKTLYANSAWRDFPMYNITQVIIRIKSGLLLIDSKGQARILTDSFAVRRLNQLDLDPVIDGSVYCMRLNELVAGEIMMNGSMSERNDRFIILDVEHLKIVERGVVPKKQETPSQ